MNNDVENNDTNIVNNDACGIHKTDLDKIFESVTEEFNKRPVSGDDDCDKPEPDNPPKFINRPVPNPDYFKTGEPLIID